MLYVAAEVIKLMMVILQKINVKQSKRWKDRKLPGIRRNFRVLKLTSKFPGAHAASART